ncbi:tyrosine-type recombinase/integrase [Acetobacterium fimetarium]|uniref:Tyrosine-type recombinase/integrase n=1 Tax=Acetobacterium fimetarium TaxID=52691 RepID=A0ABR6WRV9_9FIRM|nr:tyrosine recombinase XerC [Acetobacterium fimetarium]MBC3803267.1 tyrosine-type recombinase/integrase [Acetobacterium fimetarium]
MPNDRSTSDNKTTPNNQIIDEYLNYLLTIKGYSEKSAQAYRYDLIIFFRFIKRYFAMVPQSLDFDEIPIDDISVSDLKSVNLGILYAYLSFTSKERHNSDYARSRKVSSLRSFFNYVCNKQKYFLPNPVTDLEMPKLPARNARYLEWDEAVDLLKGIKGRHKERDFAIITLFLNCGMRLSELTQIKISDIKNDTIRIIGKGNKERTIYLNRACLKAINSYLLVRPESDSPYLFLSQQNLPISNRAVQHLVKKHLSECGLNTDEISVHKLRHTAATLMFRYGNADLRSVQEILGHENVSTTQIYTHVNEETLRDTLNHNPLAQFEKEDE